MNSKVRVLVVDDSALMRKLIPQTLLRDSSIEVIGTAMDGLIGLKKIQELRPDVVTLDLEMPRMDGLEMLRQITRKYQVPVIVVSAHSELGASLTLKALALGAFDSVIKPRNGSLGQIEQIAGELAAKIKAAAAAGVPRLLASAPVSPQKKPRIPSKTRRWPSHIVAVGISTGGPNALQYLLPQLPGDFSGCLLIVQHMPEGFTDTFARRLDESSALEVKEAQSGDLLLAGRALISPGNQHLKVRRLQHGNIAVLVDLPPVNGHRPSVDVLFQSVAQEFGPQAISVLMTGMGDDGAAGMCAIQAAGGLTIAQSPDTCVVDSMPRAAIERGCAMRVVSLSSLACVLQTKCPPEEALPEPIALAFSENLFAGAAAARRRSS